MLKEYQLNDYQQLMLRITQVSPYNAVHIVAIDKNYDMALLQKKINLVLNQLGVGQPNLCPRSQTVHFLALQEPWILKFVALPLIKHVEYEMNDAFRLEECPLRFFLLQTETQTYFCMTYNHWVADAYSISRLLQGILSDDLSLLTLQSPSMAECFPSQFNRFKTLYYRYFGVLKHAILFAKAYRTEFSKEENLETGCCYYFFQSDDLSRLLALCRVKNITLNDFFIVILAQTFGEFTTESTVRVKRKIFKPKRDRLIIAVISNLRPYSHLTLSHVFGVFLGVFYLGFRRPEHDGFEHLCQWVHDKTRALKRKHSALKQYFLFQIQKKLWDRAQKTRSKCRLFTKNIPVVVGISNMNLPHWGEIKERPYLRFSPTAMVCPIVFNITTVENDMALGISFRKAAYTDSEINRIQACFIHKIMELVAH